ncbi:BgTH12-04713 [Blumeria graminis f. sp. triticale]|uniref:BgTH12-04713 n=1 Tax=Blumeria graminis f. sp. triticale TaxID=1689686 RepID=A0A9W4DGG9_BLUGR|nr:BgTH12-04713 [Blumeria graminis f. sp. triticale]
MKFLSTATAAALASLLLLVPTVYGNRQYKCPSGDTFEEAMIMDLANKAREENNRDSHPGIPTHELCKSYFFTRKIPGDDSKQYAYLLQVYGQPPTYQFSQQFNYGWQQCSLENGS